MMGSDYKEIEAAFSEEHLIKRGIGRDQLNVMIEAHGFHG